jgi:hypothetical protein
LLRLTLILCLLLLPLPVSAQTITGVASVTDGDSLEIRGTRIRLHAIDAPESRQLCTRPSGQQWRCGQQAALALSDRIGRRSVSCVTRDIDRYGRTIAVCSQDGFDLNRWMVSEGGLCHVGLERSLVDECQPRQHVAHERLAMVDPDIARQRHIRPLLLDRAQVFFCVSGQGHAAAARPRHGGHRRRAHHEVRPPAHQASGRVSP